MAFLSQNQISQAQTAEGRLPTPQEMVRGAEFAIDKDPAARMKTRIPGLLIRLPETLDALSLLQLK